MHHFTPFLFSGVERKLNGNCKYQSQSCIWSFVPYSPWIYLNDHIIIYIYIYTHFFFTYNHFINIVLPKLHRAFSACEPSTTKAPFLRETCSQRHASPLDHLRSKRHTHICVYLIIGYVEIRYSSFSVPQRWFPPSPSWHPVGTFKGPAARGVSICIMETWRRNWRSEDDSNVTGRIHWNASKATGNIMGYNGIFISYTILCKYMYIISWDGMSWDTMGYHGIQQASNGMSWHDWDVVIQCDIEVYIYVYI